MILYLTKLIGSKKETFIASEDPNYTKKLQFDDNEIFILRTDDEKDKEIQALRRALISHGEICELNHKLKTENEKLKKQLTILLEDKKFS